MKNPVLQNFFVYRPARIKYPAGFSFDIENIPVTR